MKPIVFVILGGVFLMSVSSAQMPGGPPPDPCAALGKFFNRDAAFTASAKVVTTGKKARDNSTMVLLFAVSGGNLRNEMDLTKMSGVPAREVAGMQQMGMDKMVILKRTDQQTAYIVYPNLQSYCDLPAGRDNAEGQVVKTALGRETVANHACAKSKLTFTNQAGQTSEALVWEAADMQDFPIQYQTVDAGQTTTTTFSDIQMGQPAAALFAVPADYKKYGSMQEMMMGNMQRLMPQQ